MFRRNIFLPSSGLNNFRNMPGYVGKYKEGPISAEERGRIKISCPSQWDKVHNDG
jgi:hypothetical protein